MNILCKITTLLFLSFMTACTESDPNTYALTGLRIVDTESGEIHTNRTLVIKNDTFPGVYDAEDP